MTGYWFGFFPLQEKVVEKMKLKEPKKTLLRLLMQNARMPLKELAAKMKLPISTTQYHLDQLLESEYIIRASVVAEKPLYNVISWGFWNYRIAKDFMSEDLGLRQYLTREAQDEAMNRLLLSFNVAGGGMDDIVAYAHENLEEAHDALTYVQKKFAKNLRELPHGIAMKTLLGNFPIRKLPIQKYYRSDFVDIYREMEK